jgi:hypothetical protein
MDSWIPTPVTNYLVRNYDRILDIFLSGRLNAEVNPASRSQSDIEAARAARALALSEYDRLKTAMYLHGPAAAWLILTGSCVLSAQWAAKAGSKIRQPKMDLVTAPVEESVLRCPDCGYSEVPQLAPERCPTCFDKPFLEEGRRQQTDNTGQGLNTYTEEQKKDGSGTPLYDTYTVGQVEENAINILNWFPQPASTFEQVRYVVEVDPMDLDRVRDLFGNKAKEVVGEKLDYENWAGIDAAPSSGLGMNDDEDRERVMVKILRHIPDHRFKKGCLLITANGHILHKNEDGLDATDGKLSSIYTYIKYREIPGQFWGGSAFSDQLPLQKRINSIDSHIVINRKQMAGNQWLIPEGAGVDHVSGKPGLTIHYNPHTSGGFKPERLPGIPVTAQVTQEREVAVRDLDEISGAREILQGGLPPGSSGLETGAAVEFLQEQAFKRFGQAIRSWRLGLGQHEHNKLKIIQHYWTEKRIVTALGDNKQLESHYFSGADIHSAQDMQVTIGLGADFSEVAQQQKIMKAAESGLLGDLRQPQVRGKILEQLNISGFDSEYVVDAIKARRILQGLRDGVSEQDLPTFIPQIDNPAIQFEIFREFILSSDYEQLDDNRQQQILQRAMQMQQVLQQKQQEIMANAERAKGTSEQATDAMAASGALGGQSVETQAVGG